MIKRKVAEERRIILKHADDPNYSNGIGCYLREGGYKMLKKSFKLKPEQIGEEVLKSGVRGRGGAGGGACWGRRAPVRCGGVWHLGSNTCCK